MSTWTRRVVLLALAALVVAAFARLSHDASRGGESAPVYSTRRFDPHGAAALYRLMQRRAPAAETLERPRLRPHHRGTLLQIVPGSEDATEENPYRLPDTMLLEWVVRGNTVVQMSRAPTSLMRELGVKSIEPSDGETMERQAVQRAERRGEFPERMPGLLVSSRWRDAGDVDAAEASAPAATRWVTLRAPLVFDAEQPEGWRTLLQGGGVVAGVIPHGDGRVVFVGAPTPALNGALDERDNLAFMLEVLGDGPIIFGS